MPTIDVDGGGDSMSSFSPFDIIGGAVSGIANMGAAAINAESQRDTNQANIQSAREQMNFQNNMSSTAYQRAVLDMKGAGLNPALAYSQGGASSPSGAMATSVAPRSGDMLSGAASGIATAVNLRNQVAQTDKIKSDTNLNANVDSIQKAQRRNLDTENRISSAAAAKAEAEAEFYKSDFGKKYAIPLRETLGLGSSAANILSSGTSILKALKSSPVASGTLSSDEKKVLEGFKNYQKGKRRMP